MKILEVPIGRRPMFYKGRHRAPQAAAVPAPPTPTPALSDTRQVSAA